MGKKNTFDKILKYDANAMILYQEATGKDIFKLFADLTKDMESNFKLPKEEQKSCLELLSISDMRALLYAGLKRSDEAITLEKAGELIDIHNVVDVFTAIITAYSKGNRADEPFLPREPSAESTSESQTKNLEG